MNAEPSEVAGGFVVQAGSPLDEVQMRLKSHLTSTSDPLICVTGLPGIGKTGLCFEQLRQLRGEFAAVAVVDGRNRSLEESVFVDALYKQLPIGAGRDSESGDGVDEIIAFFRSTRVLVVIDNADAASIRVAEFCALNLSPSVILVNVRDATEFRRLAPRMVEIQHPGLTASEMEELFGRLLENDPILARKAELARPEHLQLLLRSLKGWPQALLLACVRLSTSSDNVRDIVPGANSQVDLYRELLGDMFSTLPAEDQRILEAGAAFPASFTLQGAAAVAGASIESAEQAIVSAVRCRLLHQQAVDVFRVDHPVVLAYLRDRNGRGGDQFDAPAGEYLRRVCEEHGGSPDEDWSNFVALDSEVDNLQNLLLDLAAGDRAHELHSVFAPLFSYMVERGHWVFVDEICRRGLSTSGATTEQADWLIWSSWISYYLKDDPADSLAMAEQVPTLRGIFRRQRFEGHRRALVAGGQLREEATVSRHYLAALDCLDESSEVTLDQQIDLCNAHGDALRKRADASDDLLLDLAMNEYTRAQGLVADQAVRNARELSVALIGQAQVKLAQGQVEDARRLVQTAESEASRLRWLRGMAECARVSSGILDKLRDDAAAARAAERAAYLLAKLRAGDTTDAGW